MEYSCVHSFSRAIHIVWLDLIYRVLHNILELEFCTYIWISHNEFVFSWYIGELVWYRRYSQFVYVLCLNLHMLTSCNADFRYLQLLWSDLVQLEWIHYRGRVWVMILSHVIFCIREISKWCVYLVRHYTHSDAFFYLKPIWLKNPEREVQS